MSLQATLPSAPEAVAYLAFRLGQTLQANFRPPPTMNLVEWADTYRKLSPEASSKPGQWKTSEVEVARGPMLAVTDPEVDTITLMACTQLMKTEFINNAIGYHIDLDPAPMLFILNSLEMAEAWSKDRLAPMLRDTPTLQGKVKDSSKRGSNNTILHKQFPGGHITMAGANSPGSLASRPIRIVVEDEVDKYPTSAGKEGDPVDLAEERAATFWNSLFIRCCSPTIKGASRIEMSFNESDKRRFFVPCPHCEHRQYLRWAQVNWEKDKNGKSLPETAAYACESCGALWSEKERLSAISAAGRLPDAGWRQTADFICCDIEHNATMWNEKGRSLCHECGKESHFNGHAGFHANKIASPWKPLSDLVEKFLNQKNTPSRLQIFVNTQLAESFEIEHSEEISEKWLMQRRENWGKLAPEEVIFITAGVDVQGNRLEVELFGWGVGEEKWSLDYHTFYGSPAEGDVWQELDSYLQQEIETEAGVKLSIGCSCIDTGGHHAQEAYDFCRPRAGRRIFGIKGLSTPGKPIFTKPSTKNKGKILLYALGVDTAKERIYSRLKIAEPGKYYSHFPMDRDEEYFRQLVAEKMVMRVHNGKPCIAFEKREASRRNEVLDLHVYGLAALYIGLSVNRNTLERMAEELFTPPAPPPKKEEKQGESWLPRKSGWLDR